MALSLHTLALMLNVLSNPVSCYGLVNEDRKVGTRTALSKINNQDPRAIYSVDQVQAGKSLHPAERIYHDYSRWRHEVPSAIAEAANAAGTETGTVQAVDQPGDAGYLVPLTIGGQKFLLNLDTGSSDFWVFSKQLPKADWGTHSIYKETGKQYTNPLETWDVSYADGSGASGNVWLDNVNFGGVKIPAVIEAATEISENLVKKKQDGIIGFAFNSGNTCRPYGCETFMTLASPHLKLPLFTATLRKGKAGTYDFGFVDATKYTGKIGYVKSDNSSGYWGLSPSGFSIGAGKEQSFAFSTIADSGTVLLYVPNTIMNAYYPNVKGAYLNPSDQYVYFPCTSKLPSFSLFINGHKATVPGSYLNAGAINKTICLGGMQAEGHVGANIIGDQFLKSQFVVFDLRGPTLGFAQQKNLPAS